MTYEPSRREGKRTNYGPLLVHSPEVLPVGGAIKGSWASCWVQGAATLRSSAFSSQI